MAFLPVLIPIALITLHSFYSLIKNPDWMVAKIIAFLGEPVIALTIGIVLTFLNARHWPLKIISKLLQESAEKAGGILVIIGAGGAFGAVLAATHTATLLSQSLNLASMGIFFPFLLTFILKTAQGSSTVAIITAATIVFPLLPALHLTTENGKLLAVLSMGAGSMMISHANDAYFWVVAKFSGLDMRSMLRIYSIATLWMGLVTLLTIYILSLLIL
jgi:GntP family gluconate:H+ symporter